MRKTAVLLETGENSNIIIIRCSVTNDSIFGPVVRVPGYRSRGARSIPGAARFSEK
jgi:hypothetical protein